MIIILWLLALLCLVGWRGKTGLAIWTVGTAVICGAVYFATPIKELARTSVSNASNKAQAVLQDNMPTPNKD